MIVGARAKGFAPRDPKEAMAEIKKRIEESVAEDVPEIMEEIAKARLPASLTDILLRGIKRRHGATLAALREDLVTARRDGRPPPEEKDQLDYANEVEQNFGAGNLVFALGYFWLWGSSVGVWRRADDREIKHVAQTVLTAEDAHVSKGLVDGIADIMKNKLLQTPAPFDRPNWKFINTANGTIEWTDEAWTLRAHRRSDFLTTQLPVLYDPHATCPRFAQFLQEVFAGDTDADDKATCVLEMMGYTLLMPAIGAACA